MIVMMVAFLIALPIAILAAPDVQNSDELLEFLTQPFILLVMLLIQDTILVAVPYFIYIKSKLLTWAELGLEGEDLWTRAAQGMMVGFAFSGSVIALVYAIGHNTSGGVPIVEKMTVIDYILLLLGGSVIAPIAEEFFFRGIAFKGLKKYYEMRGNTRAFPIALLFSTIIFTAAHGYGLFETAVVFVGGLIFAYLFHKTDSLITPLFAHGAYNAGMITATFLTII